jgi:serine/threonine-protein kinase
MRVAPPAGTDPAADAELRALLRKRLRFVGVLASVLYLCNASLAFMPRDTDMPGSPPHLIEHVVGWSIVAVIVATTIILWSRVPLTLARLRAAELVLFGLPALDLAVAYPRQLVASGFLLIFFQAGLPLAALLPLQYWSLLVVVYGVLIPNTGRRCARVVGTLAVVPAVLVFASGLAAEGVWERYPTFLLVTTFFAALHMGAAAAIAIYGSHRIETLRREASTARRLGQYVLREKLGGGGMGEVYRADHALLRRPAAIKLIRPERAGDPTTLARFEREVQATATLTHPNTVQVYDYGRAEDGTFYYVMEYLPGVTLDELVGRDGPLPPGRAVRLLRQLCGALREAHAIGLVHRDLKPGNVMVCDRGGVPDTAKLLDFGLVRSAGASGDEKLTQEGAVFGTPAYLSPEQAGGHGEPDARSDVYSLGAVAYFLLTGRPPFAGRSAVKMLAAHLYEVPEPPGRHRTGVPADLEAVVLRCLAKPPGERFQSVDELDAALAACAPVTAASAAR